MNCEIEVGQLGMVRACLELSLQLDKRRGIYRSARPLVRGRCVHGRLDLRLSLGLGCCRRARASVHHAHEDGAVIGGCAAKPGDVAVDLIARVAVGIAQGGLKAKLPARIHGAGGEAQVLAAVAEVVIGGDLVGARQRRRARFAVDIAEDELADTVLGDLDRAATHADRVEKHVLWRKRHGDARPAHIAPIAGAVGVHRKAQDRIDNRELVRLDRAGEQRPDIEPRFERLRLEKRLVETAVRVGHLHVVEFQLRRGQHDEMDLAVDLHLAAEQLRGLLLEGRAIVVPVDEERRSKERAQHQNEQRR